MKTIGLIGGMSWESTVTYYHVINERIKELLGGLHSAKILMYSFDFEEIERMQSAGDWDGCDRAMTEIAVMLEKAGADFLAICTNTMHICVPAMKKKVSIPIVHIAEATADVLKSKDIHKVILLGTKYTMTQDFYKNKIIDAGIDVIIPEGEDIETVNSIIYDELCLGIIKEESRSSMIAIVDKLKDSGAEGVILGCTEIGLLVRQCDTDLPVFDTTLIHAEKCAQMSVED